MKIYAPNSSVADLATNGLGNIVCASAPVHEEINGEFSITIQVPNESSHFDDVVLGAIVKADTPRGPQLFRLSKPLLLLDGGKEVFGWHISYDLAQDMITNRAWTGKTGIEALPEILQAGISETRFTGSSDIDLVTNLRIVRTSVLGAVIGEQDNSFVNRWGGEIERNNFTVNVLSRLGADKDYIIEYRKNLTGLEYEEDDDQLANRIIPTGLNSDDTVILLPEVYIDSELINETPIPHARHVHFSDVKVGKKDDDGNVLYEDIDDVRDRLRDLVSEMYAQGVDQPLKSAKVEFIDLSQTEEYKNFSILQTVELGDSVKCKYKSTVINKRVVSYDYDSLTRKYIRIVLGSVIPTLGDSLWAQDLDLSALKDVVDSKLTTGEVYNGCYINHEDGFMTIAEVGGKTITVKHNSNEGIPVYADGVQIGGIAIVDGEVRFIGSAITNSIDGDVYAVVGEVDIDGTSTPGILIYNRIGILTADIPAIQDVGVNSYFADSNFGSSNTFLLGYDSTGPQKKRVLIGFDMSQIQDGVQIAGAKLFMKQSSTTSTDDPITFDAYRVTGTWDENTATWNNQPAVEASPTITGLTCAKVTTDTWRSWDITDLLLEMVAEGSDSIILRLQSESGTYHEHRFHSSEASNSADRPYIEISYLAHVPQTEPAFSIVTAGSFLDGEIIGANTRLITRGGSQFWLSPSSLIGTRLIDKHEKNRMAVYDLDGYLASPDESKRIGVDNTGAYEYTGGAKRRFLDVDIRTGQCNLSDSAWTSVSFSSAMRGAPKVVLTANTTNTGTITAKTRNVTASGFEATIGGTATASTFHYQAIYQP